MNQRIKDGYSIAFFDYKGEKDIVDHLRSIANALNVEFYEFSIDTCDFCYDPLINLNETGKVEALMNTSVGMLVVQMNITEHLLN